MTARRYGSAAYLAAAFANATGWLRPTSVTVISGAATGGDLAVAPYPYDPDPTRRGALLKTGLTVGAVGAPAEVGLNFTVASSMVYAYGAPQVHVAQALVLSIGAPIELASGSGFTGAAGYPHADALTGPVRALFAARWAFAAGNQLRVTSEGGVIVCALGAARSQW